MKYDQIKNQNYVATVVRVSNLEKLEGLDNLVAFRQFGMQALVSSTTPVGSIGVLFSTEVQLSSDFAKYNNLYRHGFNWNSAIEDLWSMKREESLSAIQIGQIIREVSVKFAPIKNGATHQTEKSKQLLEQEIGEKITETKFENIQKNIDLYTQITKEKEEINSSQQKKEKQKSKKIKEDIILKNTDSLLSPTKIDTMSFLDVVKYVKSGGKFSSLITAILQEKSEDYCVGDVTWQLVGLEMILMVCDRLSLTSNEKKIFLEKHKNNQDPTKTGYLDDNRRVKAIKLRKHRSDSLFVSLDAFAYLGVKPEDFKVGDVFDSINGKEIVRKYVIREARENKTQPKIRKVDVKNFPQHFDTDNYWRNCHKIYDSAPVIVTQKLHGTSIRFGRIQVRRDLQWYEKLAQKIGFKIQQTEPKFVVGSRTVVKSIDGSADPDKDHVHFYAEDEWTKFIFEKTTLAETIPEGFLVYGELVGFTSTGQAIQKNYTYNCTENQSELYVYRVATITASGRVIDLSWDMTKEFCKEHGMKWCPELWRGPHAEFNVDSWMDIRYSENAVSLNRYTEEPIPLSNKDTVDEGVCVRYDGPTGPYLLKAKSPIFLNHETKLLDSGTEDMESAEAA